MAYLLPPSPPKPTTVQSFPDRGDRATHVGNYRGNSSPYIPRNLILRYTAPGELVLDQKIGSGITSWITENNNPILFIMPDNKSAFINAETLRVLDSAHTHGRSHAWIRPPEA